LGIVKLNENDPDTKDQFQRRNMMKKIYSKTGDTCRVTFELPAEAKDENVVLCSDFNDWDKSKHQLVA
jgi:hypothetical protein